MASTLEELNKRLLEITKNANLSAEALERVQTLARQQLASMVGPQMQETMRGAAKGGVPTQQGLDRLLSQFLGGGVSSGWHRAGGGSRIFFGANLTRELQQIFEQSITQTIAQALSQITSTPGSKLPGVPDQIPYAPKKKEETDAEKKLRESKEISRQTEQNEVFRRAVRKDEIADAKILAEEKTNQIKIERQAAEHEAQIAATNKRTQQELLDIGERRRKQMADLLTFSEKQEAAQKKIYSAEEVQVQMGEYRGKRLVQQAERYGFKPENIKQIYTQEPSGVTVGKFEKVDESTGAVSKLELTVDKFGNTITRTNKRLLGFTESIKRNTIEVLKWSVGVGLVYGGMYKLQALIKTAIENEAKLADIAVILGDAHRDLNQIFDESAKVAYETGESISAVLETYTLAYRAVGSISDPIKRTESAITLLTDATTLNKLSSLDASSAIDVLSGSLRQLQRPGEDMATAFLRGRDLLDAWVTVTRKANVDLATLATAFSITSESAENSGVSIEQLNAIIASLAEKIGGLGGRETGNAVRALIGGVYQQQAAEILTRYGIAVQDTAGRMRPFLDISREIYTLYKEGVVSADELNKIGYTLGGGVRRGQQYVAFLSDFERIQELTNEQVNSGGAAQEALSRKIDTTQTAITRLDNAFQSLAQTLGSDSGILDMFSGLLETTTALVGVLEDISSVLGKMTIPTAMLGITSMMFRGEAGGLRRQEFASNIGGRLEGLALGAMNLSPRLSNRKVLEERLGLESSVEMMAKKFGLGLGKYVSGTLVGAIPAAFKAASGDLEGAGITLGGAVIGAITTAGSPVGALIGSFIADAFIVQTLQHKPDFEAFFTDIFTGATEADLKQRDKAQAERDALTEEIFKRRGEGDAFTGMTFGRAAAFGFNLSNLFKTGQFGKMTPEQGALWGGIVPGKETYPDLVERLAGLRKEQQEAIPVTAGADVTKVSEIEAKRLDMLEQERDLVNEIIEARNKEIKIQSAKGEITPKEQLGMQETLLGLDAALSKLNTAFGGTFDKINTSISGTEGVYNAFTDILLEGSDEQTTSIINAASEWIDWAAAIEKAVKEGKNSITTLSGEEIELAGADGAIEQLNQFQTMWTDYLNLLRQEQQLADVKIPTVVGMEDIRSLDAFDKVYRDALRMQSEEFDTWVREDILTPEQAEIMLSRWERIAVYMGDTLGTKVVEGLTDSKYLNQAFDKWKDEVSKVDLGFQTFDMTNPELARIVQQANSMASVLQQKYGYTPDITEQLAITLKDNVVEPFKADWKLVQLLLQQIEENTSELEGIYNLPEGAGFYVPYQTLQLAYQKGLNEGKGGMEGLLADQEFAYKGEGTTEAYGQGRLQPSDITDLVRSQPDPGLVASTTATVAKAVEQVYKTYLPQLSYTPPKATPRNRFDTEGFGQEPSSIENMATTIKEGLMTIPQILHDYLIAPFTEGLDFKQLFSDISSNINNTVALNLNSTSTIQLVVDAKVLAEIVKTQLYQDTIAFEGSGGTINRTMVI